MKVCTNFCEVLNDWDEAEFGYAGNGQRRIINIIEKAKTIKISTNFSCVLSNSKSVIHDSATLPISPACQNITVQGSETRFPEKRGLFLLKVSCEK